MIWSDRTAVIIAGGPSLNRFDTKEIFEKNLRFITINDSWRLIPTSFLTETESFVNYFTDMSWWLSSIHLNRQSQDKGYDFSRMIFSGHWFKGSQVNEPNFRFCEHIHKIYFSGEFGLDMTPGYVRHGHNSGYAAINLVVQCGIKKVILLGYDMKVSDFRSHWHNDNKHSLNSFDHTLQHTILPSFRHIVEPLKQLGVSVINANPDSALTVFPRMSFKEALASFI